MTKQEVIQEITSKTGVDKQDVSATVEAFFKIVKNAMVEGNNVYFRGFGSFVLKKRARKVARIISKNQSIVIPEHYIPAFKPAKTFSDKVKTTVKTVSADKEKAMV